MSRWTAWLLLALSMAILSAACGGDDDPENTVPRPDSYFEQLEAFQAASLEESEELAERVLSEVERDSPREEWEPPVRQFYREYAALMDKWADELGELGPPEAAKGAHTEYVDLHRSFARQIRDGVAELKERPDVTLEDALGGFAVGYYDYLGRPCGELQRIAEDEGETVDLQCP